jgi:hypothetical protein
MCCILTDTNLNSEVSNLLFNYMFQTLSNVSVIFLQLLFTGIPI